MRRYYDIIPRDLRGDALQRLLLSFIAIALDLVSVVGFVPLMTIVVNPSTITTNPYINKLYVWSGVGTPVQFMLVVAVVLLAILIVKNVIVVLISYSAKRFSMRLFEALSLAAFADIYRRGLLYMRSKNSNKLINDVGNTTLIFATQVIGGWITILSEGFMMFLILILVAWYDIAVLGALLLLFVPFFMLYTRMLRQKMQRLGRIENEIRIAQHHNLSGAIRGYTDVKITDSLPRIMRHYGELIRNLAVPRAVGDTLREIPTRLIELVLVIGIILMLIIQSSDSSMVVTLGIFVVAAYKVIPAINRIMTAWNNIQRSEFSTLYCSEIEQASSETVSQSREPFEQLSLAGIEFSYDENEALFTDFSMTVNRGEKVLIKGVSGRGKSTLLHILMGFIVPQKGSVTINGKPIDETQLSKFGYVSQDIFIMDDTLTANITMSDRVADEQRLAQIWEWLSLDEMGVAADERLREWGSRLSGGQRQRIAIARALYRGAEILILDEPTSSLDEKSEKQILETLATQASGLTIICVSHKDFESMFPELFTRTVTL